MKFFPAIAVLLLSFVPGVALASAPVESFTLANGLEVVVIPNSKVPAVTHMMWYKVGAGEDPVGKSGLAHFHEHMMFEGSPHYPSGQYSVKLGGFGGDQNAFTGWDATAYYVTLPKDQLAQAMELEADRMRALTPTDADTAKEKQVIIEERRMRIENDPSALLAEQMNAALFRNHPYHTPVIGWMHEMEGLTKDDVLKFHQTYYHPNNAILVISGDITTAEVKTLAQKYYGGVPRAAVPPRKWKEEPPQIAERRVVLHHPNVQQPAWTRDYAGASLGYGDKSQALPLFVLTQIIAGGKSSRLYQALVVDKKMAAEVDSDYDGFVLGPGTLEISVTPEPGVDFTAMESVIDEQLEKLAHENVSADELMRAKTQLKAESTFARDGLMPMARLMGTIRVMGLQTDYFTQWPSLIEAVTPEQVKKAAADTLERRRSVTGLLLPEGK